MVFSNGFDMVFLKKPISEWFFHQGDYWLLFVIGLGVVIAVMALYKFLIMEKGDSSRFSSRGVTGVMKHGW